MFFSFILFYHFTGKPFNVEVLVVFTVGNDLRFKANKIKWLYINIYPIFGIIEVMRGGIQNGFATTKKL